MLFYFGICCIFQVPCLLPGSWILLLFSFCKEALVVGILILLGTFSAAWSKTKKKLDMLDAKAYEKKLRKKFTEEEMFESDITLKQTAHRLGA